MEILEIAEKYSDLIQAFGTIGLVVVTIFLYFATTRMALSSKLLVKENKALREESKTPRILIKLKLNTDQGSFIDLIMSNVGQGVALNVKFRLDEDHEDMKQRGIDIIQGNQEPINYLSSGEFEVYFFGSTHDFLQDYCTEPFVAIVEYEDVDGQTYEDRIMLDVKQFYGISWQNSSVAWRSMSALEKIEKTLGQVHHHLSK